MPIVYQLSILLVDGLGENFLLEICARFSNDNDLEKEFNKNSLSILMKTADDQTQVDSTKDHREMLESFSVGTDKRKRQRESIPDPAFIGPVRKIQRMSAERKASILMGQVKVNKKCRDNTKHDRENLKTFDVNYI